MRAAVFLLVLISSLAYPLDLDVESFCKGMCMNRYQDGIALSGKCACIDYYPINLSGRIDSFRKPKPPE